MELQELDSEAKLGAIKDIKNMLPRPGQLEKVDLYKQREGRKKASLEAQLKTAMQNQLDDDGLGQRQLENSMAEIKIIDAKYAKYNKKYFSFYDYSTKCFILIKFSV